MRILGQALLFITVASFDALQRPLADRGISSTEQAAIRSAYGAMARAFEQHHTERMRTYLAAEFLETRQGSATTRSGEQFLQEIAEECKHARAPIHVHFELTRFERAGSEVVADVDEDTTYLVRGNDRRMHAIEYRQRSQDRWIRQSGAWKCLRESDELPYLTRVDDHDVTLQQLAKLLQ